jgi:MFS family permease
MVYGPAKRKSLCAGIGLLFFVASSYVHQPPPHCPTPLSRLDLLHALVQGKVNIDSFHENTPDKAYYDGHFYSDKAPGTVALAFPPFALAAGLLKLFGISLDSDKGWLLSSWIACVLSIGIITALGACSLFSWLDDKVGPRPALITTLALFFGAAPFPYATMMFSHSLVVALICIALWSLSVGQASRLSYPSTALTSPPPTQTDNPHQSPEVRPASLKTWLTSHRWDLLAGHACGWALASEYTAGLVILALLLWVFFQDRRRTLPFCLAAIPPLLLIPIYSWACLGNPFTLPYSFNPSFPEMKEGLYAIKWPDPETAFNLLFSPSRGLFFWTPFMVILSVGYWKLMKADVRLFWLIYAVPLLQIVVISGRTWDWPAGPSLGPRYLAPILPLLALPCAFGVKWLPKIGAFLAAPSILMTTTATLTNACPSASFQNPLVELHISQLRNGQIAPNLGTLFGLWPTASIALFYVLLTAGIAWLWARAGGRTAAEDAPVLQSSVST